MNAATSYAPVGFDAPRHSHANDNYRAACIAARDVRLRAISCPIHRASLEAWEQGERSWPWPDPTPEQQAQADASARALVNAYLRTADKGLRAFSREGR